MTCVCLNTQYFYIGIVQFESQEYTLEGGMQFFAKLGKIRLFQARFIITKVLLTYIQKINRFCAKNNPMKPQVVVTTRYRVCIWLMGYLLTLTKCNTTATGRSISIGT